MAETKFGTFEELLETMALDLQPVGRRLKEIIQELDPNAVEVVRLGDRAATYGVGPKKMSEGYTYILPHAKWINLGFYKGADIPDPTGLLEGTGAKMRHVKVRDEASCQNPVIRDLLIAALNERKSALGRD